MMQAMEGPAAPPRPPSRVGYWLAAMIAPAAVLMMAWWFGVQQHQLDTMRAVNRASYERRFAAADFLRGLDEAESAQRGYVITASPEFLAMLQARRMRAPGDLARLDTLYRGEPGQEARLVRLHVLADAKFAEMQHVIALRQKGGFAAASSRVSTRQGVLLMDQARALVAALAGAEQATLGYRLDYVRAHYLTMGRFVWALMLVAVLSLWLGLWLAWRLQSARHLTERAAHAAAARLRAIFASTTDTMLIVDPAGRIQAANAAATRMLGFRPEELVGRDVAELLDIGEGEGAFGRRIGLADGRLAQTHWLDRTIAHRDGHAVPVDIALGLMPLPDGIDIVAAIRDISERKAVERLKDEFVSTVSHELRTPLTSVVGSLGLLRAGSVGQLPDAARRLVEIAENNSRRLIRLINDILDIEKIGSGRMHFERAPIDLARLLEGAADDSRGLADSRGVVLALAVVDRPAMVHGDGDRLVQVIGNLLSNAIRFSPAGGTVRITLAAVDGEAVVTVDDEGPGVSAEFRGRVFERFAQADDGASREGGTGLGLAISREIIETHGGRIWFGQADSGGARFAFALRLHAVVSPNADPRARVVVHEPDREAADAIRAVLEEDGCLVDCVASAEAAEEAARSGRYDGLVIGLSAQREGALDAVRALRRGADTRMLPIVVVAAAPDQGDEDAALSAFDLVDWIDKPVDHQRLVDAVRRAIDHSAAGRPTLLHVDDDADMLEVAATALAGHGRMLRATSLAAARDLLARQTPDIVILDVALPDGSGLDLLPELTLGDGSAIPTIVYSATDVMPEIEDRVDAVLVKSRRSLPNLARIIRRLLENEARAPR